MHSCHGSLVQEVLQILAMADKPNTASVVGPAACCLQDFYLEDVLKFIGYKAPDNYTQESHDNRLSNGGMTAPLSGQQKGVIEQAIMEAFLKGDEGSWERLLQVTGAQEGAGNPACLNVAHQATGEMG